MPFEQKLRIVLTTIGLALIVYWIIPFGILSWFHSDKLEKMWSEQAKDHW